MLSQKHVVCTELNIYFFYCMARCARYSIPWPTSGIWQWETVKKQNLTTKEIISIFPLWTFHLVYVATFQQHLHMEYISLSSYDIPELLLPIRTSLVEACCQQGSYWTNGSYWMKLKSSLWKFYGRHHDLVDRYGISVSQITTDMFHLS